MSTGSVSLLANRARLDVGNGAVMMPKYGRQLVWWNLIAAGCRLTFFPAEVGHVHSEQELPSAVDPEQRALQGMWMRVLAKVKDMILNCFTEYLDLTAVAG